MRYAPGGRQSGQQWHLFAAFCVAAASARCAVSPMAPAASDSPNSAINEYLCLFFIAVPPACATNDARVLPEKCYTSRVGYSVQDVAKLLGVSVRQVQSYVRDGFLAPAVDGDGTARFS